MKISDSARGNRRGFTLPELLVMILIIGLALVAINGGFQSFFNRIRITNGLRRVTSAMHTARYKAVTLNKRIKFSLESDSGRIALKEKKGRRWVEFMQFPLETGVTVTCNTSPVFRPDGGASPLCSVYVRNNYYGYKISLSMAGRIKVTKLWSNN